MSEVYLAEDQYYQLVHSLSELPDCPHQRPEARRDWYRNLAIQKLGQLGIWPDSVIG